MKTINRKSLVLVGASLLLLRASALAQSSGCPCPALLPPNNGGQVDISAPWLITGDFTAAKNPAYFSAQVTSGPSDVPDGTYIGWCVDVGNDIGHGPNTYSALFFASCDPNLNQELGPEYPSSVYVSPDVWHEVNYILNHKNGAYFWNIQLAIWTLVGGPIPASQLAGPPSVPPADLNQVNALVAAAQANAAAWQPQCGDVTAIVVQIPNLAPVLQLLILEVPCTCVCTGQIGDFVWQDLNGNGCQDAGEPGIPGMKVDLYSGCGPNAVLVASTTTDANGKYLFTGLCAGNYSVAFHTPAGYMHTLAHQACNVGGLPSNQTDSDCECTGTADCAVCVNLPTSNSQDLTIDCGYVSCDPTCSLAVPTPLPVCGSAGNTLSGPDGMISYQWTIVAATDPGWQITAGADQQTVTYSAGATGTATFHLQTFTALGCQKDCEVTFGCAMSQGGCRVTGGSNKQLNTWQGPCVLTPAPSFVSHGGQVGASHAGETEFTPYSLCISGEWEHDRHLKGNSLVGVLHAAGNGSTHQYDSLLCACLPCDTTAGTVGKVGEICNPNDRNCGPLPSKAPANKICFSGVGDYTDTTGPKTIKAVFRVDIEDRSEGNSQASAPPPDRYRIRIWLLGTTCRPFGPDSAQGLALRFAVSADASKIANLATTEMLKLPAVAGAPDIDDGGDMTQGNHQIHPETGATCP